VKAKTTIENVTDDQIRALLGEAKAAGDADMVYTCRSALNTVCNRAAWLRARKACAEAIREAESA